MEIRKKKLNYNTSTPRAYIFTDTVNKMYNLGIGNHRNQNQIITH